MDGSWGSDDPFGATVDPFAKPTTGTGTNSAPPLVTSERTINGATLNLQGSVILFDELETQYIAGQIEQENVDTFIEPELNYKAQKEFLSVAVVTAKCKYYRDSLLATLELLAVRGDTTATASHANAADTDGGNVSMDAPGVDNRADSVLPKEMFFLPSRRDMLGTLSLALQKMEPLLKSGKDKKDCQEARGYVASAILAGSTVVWNPYLLNHEIGVRFPEVFTGDVKARGKILNAMQHVYSSATYRMLLAIPQIRVAYQTVEKQIEYRQTVLLAAVSRKVGGIASGKIRKEVMSRFSDTVSRLQDAQGEYTRAVRDREKRTESEYNVLMRTAKFLNEVDAVGKGFLLLCVDNDAQVFLNFANQVAFAHAETGVSWMEAYLAKRGESLRQGLESMPQSIKPEQIDGVLKEYLRILKKAMSRLREDRAVAIERYRDKWEKIVHSGTDAIIDLYETETGIKERRKQEELMRVEAEKMHGAEMAAAEHKSKAEAEGPFDGTNSAQQQQKGRAGSAKEGTDGEKKKGGPEDAKETLLNAAARAKADGWFFNRSNRVGPAPSPTAAAGSDGMQAVMAGAPSMPVAPRGSQSSAKVAPMVDVGETAAPVSIANTPMAASSSAAAAAAAAADKRRWFRSPLKHRSSVSSPPPPPPPPPPPQAPEPSAAGQPRRVSSSFQPDFLDEEQDQEAQLPEIAAAKPAEKVKSWCDEVVEYMQAYYLTNGVGVLHGKDLPEHEGDLAKADITVRDSTRSDMLNALFGDGALASPFAPASSSSSSSSSSSTGELSARQQQILAADNASANYTLAVPAEFPPAQLEVFKTFLVEELNVMLCRVENRYYAHRAEYYISHDETRRKQLAAAKVKEKEKTAVAAAAAEEKDNDKERTDANQSDARAAKVEKAQETMEVGSAAALAMPPFQRRYILLKESQEIVTTAAGVVYKWLLSPALCFPTGIYTWDGELADIWRENYFLAQPLQIGPATMIEKVMRQPGNKWLLGAYSWYMELLRTVWNPFVSTDKPLSDINKQPQFKYCFRPRCSDIGQRAQEMVASGGANIDISERSPLSVMIEFIQKDLVNLEPGPFSGWRDYFYASLEPIARSKMCLSNFSGRVEFGQRYQTTMADVCYPLCDAGRGVHKTTVTSNALKVKGHMEDLDENSVTPALTVEPAMSTYLTCAFAFRYIRKLLATKFSPQLLQKLKRFLPQYGSSTHDRRKMVEKDNISVLEEAKSLEQIFYGLFYINCDELGLSKESVIAETAAWGRIKEISSNNNTSSSGNADGISSGGGDDAELFLDRKACTSLARAWIAGLHRDIDLGLDTRKAYPSQYYGDGDTDALFHAGWAKKKMIARYDVRAQPKVTMDSAKTMQQVNFHPDVYEAYYPVVVKAVRMNGTYPTEVIQYVCSQNKTSTLILKALSFRQDGKRRQVLKGIAAQVSPDVIEEIDTWFNCIDVLENGKVGKQIISAYFSSVGGETGFFSGETMFYLMDRNCDGFIDANEFRLGILNIYKKDLLSLRGEKIKQMRQNFNRRAVRFFKQFQKFETHRMTEELRWREQKRVRMAFLGGPAEAPSPSPSSNTSNKKMTGGT